MEEFETRLDRLRDYEPILGKYKVVDCIHHYMDQLIVEVEDYYTLETELLKMVTLYCKEDEIDKKIYELLRKYHLESLEKLESTPYKAYEQYIIEEDEVIGVDLLFICRDGYHDIPYKDIYNEAYSYLRGNDSIHDEYYGIKILNQGVKDEDSRCECMLGYCLEYGLGIEQDFEEAAKMYYLSSLHGEVNGFFNYGNCLIEGRGVEINVQEGIEYLEKAGELGLSKAYLVLGNLYLDSDNEELAFDCFLNAKKMGDGSGAYFMGYCYEMGLGVQDDMQKAYMNYIEAVSLGIGDASLRVGMMYEEGKGVDQDFVKAAFYYKQAIQQGCYLAYTNLGNLYEDGKLGYYNRDEARKLYQQATSHGITRAYYDLYYLERKDNPSLAYRYLEKAIDANYSLAYIQRGKLNIDSKDESLQILAYQDFLKAYELDDLNACFWLGYCFEYGKGVSQSYEQALRFYHMASENGSSLAANALGVFYEYGYGTTKDANRAFYYYERSALLDLPSGNYNLALCYEEGLGCKKDTRKALLYLKKAAGLGSVKAKYHLGLLYEKGKYVKQNLELAFEYYEESANLNFLPGITSLGLCYEKGIGCTIDIQKSKELYLKAAKRNHPRALYLLGSRYIKEGSYEVGIAYLELAKDQNYTLAYLDLGDLYLKGEYVIQDEQKAIEYYLATNSNEGYYKLGKIYKSKDLQKAIEYFKKCVNHELAKFELGLIYNDLQQYETALAYYIELEKMNNPYAINNLAIMYEYGQGVKKDIEKAIELFKRAIDLNNPHAAYNLSLLYLGIDIEMAIYYIEVARKLGEDVSELEKEVRKLQK